MTAFSAQDSLGLIETLENWLEKNRTAENIRHQIDIGYRIEGLSIYLFEIRPQYKKPENIVHHDYAKATYVKSSNAWKVYWMRSNLKWYPYDPKPKVKSLKDFLKLVDEDKHGCFKG